MISLPEASDKVTVSEALLVSSVKEISSIVIVGGISSSTIVSVPVASVIVAPRALDNVTVAVSLSSSSKASSITGTTIVPERLPAGIVKIPEVAVKSSPEVEIGRASVGKECRSRWSPYH